MESNNTLIKQIEEIKKAKDDIQDQVNKKTREAKANLIKLNKVMMQAMTTLVNTIDAKDTYTTGHSVRVAKYSKEIAKRYGYKGKDLEDIYFIALLHDIGKIGIPDWIINKKDKLSKEEFSIIMTHPVKGYEILKDLTEMPEIAIGAKYHHERIDGGGYPEGLKGDEIPEVARIIAVSDMYDAMSSNRSYRSYLSQGEIKSEIQRVKGTQLDERFADIMLQIINEDKEYKLHE